MTDDVERLLGLDDEWSGEGWIGVDLDGTLAMSKEWTGPADNAIGKPVIPMMHRVMVWMRAGLTVKIFTARCSSELQLKPVQAWLDKYGLGHLEITNVKDYNMMELWDDRAVQVIKDTGNPVEARHRCSFCGEVINRTGIGRCVHCGGWNDLED